MKTSEKIAIVAAGIGLVAGLFVGAYTSWVAGLVIGLIAAGAAYQGLLKQVALENVANLKDQKR